MQYYRLKTMRDATFLSHYRQSAAGGTPFSRKYIIIREQIPIINIRAPARYGCPKRGRKRARSRRGGSPCGRKSAACFRMPQESCGRQKNRLPSFSREDGFLRGQPALIFRNVYSLIHLTGRPVFCCSA